MRPFFFTVRNMHDQGSFPLQDTTASFPEDTEASVYRPGEEFMHRTCACLRTGLRTKIPARTFDHEVRCGSRATL